MIFTNLIQTNLRTRRFGKEIEYYQRLGSTNLEAWDLIENNEASHGMIVITDNQFQGKGRNGKSWFMSPSKGLAMSLVMLEPLSLKKAELISIAAGVAVAKALKNRGGKPKLKWPNDILLGSKKCGGILCESRISGQTVNSMVIGIGLNINETENDFPEKLSQSATSLSIETQHSNQRELVCAMVFTFFEQLLDDLDSVTNEWTNYCAHLNEITSFNHNGVTQHGMFKGINDRGQAQIEIEEEVQLFPSIILD